MNATAFDALTGKQRWQVALAKTGEVRRIRVSSDGTSVALLSTSEGGRTFVLRDGKVIARVSKAWFRVRDTYGVEIADGQDEGLLLAITVCIDALSDVG